MNQLANRAIKRGENKKYEPQSTEKKSIKKYQHVPNLDMYSKK